ncbi:MAG: 2-hydroxychromene-2-carboxylate isomerase [Burkholderiaceae bacterium]|nr:2-hydroxychromene-2-carboxylate isomerase [Burkholderiaceae bacterium]
MSRVECFFDCASPWTYLCVHNLRLLASERKMQVRWCPILVGGVFNAVNPSVYAARDNPVPAKARYHLKSLQDWARLAGLKIVFPPSVFPVNSVKVMRACVTLEEQGRMLDFARAAFEAYFGSDLDISEDAVLAQLCGTLGVDPIALAGAIATPRVKAQLRANTEELIERGGFGSPTMFVDRHDMYFGNDSLALVRAALDAHATPGA